MVKPYYQDEWVTIYHGDCREILPHLTNIDMVFTSPPYNMGNTTGGGCTYTGNGARFRLGYDSSSDNLPEDEYAAFQKQVLLQCWKTLTESGAIYYNHKPRVLNYEVQLPIVFNPGLPLRQVVIWNRRGGSSFGEGHYVGNCEWILIFAKKEFRLLSKSASATGDIWDIPEEREGLGHPAPFPIALPSKAILTTNAAIILDPFAGSGSTLLAAKKLNRQSIGIEISERYCEIAARRCSQSVFDFTKAVKVSGGRE